MNGGEQLHSILIHMKRHSITCESASVEEMLMNKTKLTFAVAALCGGLLALAPMSGASAAPVRQSAKPLPRTIFVRRFTTTATITIVIITTGTITIAIIVTVGGATAIATAVGGKDRRAVKRLLSLQNVRVRSVVIC
jgi:hypothetical protein